MREDLLTEHIPKINVNCLENAATQNTTHVIDLVQEDDFIQSSRINLPGYNDIEVTKIPDVEISSHLTIPKKRTSTVKKKQEPDDGKNNCESSSNNDGFAKNLHTKLGNSSKSFITAVEGPETLASNLGWGTDDDDDEVIEIRPFPTRFYLEQEPLAFWETEFKIDKSLGLESNMCAGSEFLCGDDLQCEFSEKPEVGSTVVSSELSNCSLLPERQTTIIKPFRFYSRIKKMRKVNNVVKCWEKLNVDGNVSSDRSETLINGEESNSTVCVISEVVGNAEPLFSRFDCLSEGKNENLEISLITPKKTNDITKIKGWRRKQFFVEKPTTVEFYSFTKGNADKIIEVEDTSKNETKIEEPGNKENAFVCDTLDEFLDREAELKINYEIPHLYAEVGIKLTSEEIVSRPNLPQEVFKEVETKYCVPIALFDTDNISCDVLDDKKSLKRKIEENEETFKTIKLEEGKKRIVKTTSKPADKIKTDTKNKNFKLKSDANESYSTSEDDLKDFCKDLNYVNLSSKLIGLVVYPGVGKPLHPVVQLHLRKIRSYRTKIDKNWANFAVSAVVAKEKLCRRCILPVYCCGKTVQEPSDSTHTREVQNVVQTPVDFEKEKCSQPFSDEVKETDKNMKELNNTQPAKKVSLLKNRDIKLKNCKVVIDKISNAEKFKIWCMEHNCYNCTPCGFKNVKNVKPISEEIELINLDDSDSIENETVNEALKAGAPATLDKTVATLLAKKLRFLRFNGDIITSIDSLKTLTPNTVELIKLNFVKQNFLTGYISIWYLKPESNQVRSRAFLTFSKASPFPNAINLKSSNFSPNSLPKVITEIVFKEDSFDSNEYALLHCNGKIWEIHGCLNLAVGKIENPQKRLDKNVEQIFTSVTLPELTQLQTLSSEILQVSSSKWWVLDLSQKFGEITIKSGSVFTGISRKKFFGFIKDRIFGFVSLKKDSKDRVHGAFIQQKLLPFILIGPYYFIENSDLSLTADGCIVPFRYVGEQNPNKNNPLNFFINSVISEYGGSEKKLEGLWLCDRTRLDNTCYLEVMTTNTDDSVPRRQFNIDIEHGYSLSSLTKTSSPGSSLGIVKGNDGKEYMKQIVVYLYFEIVELGYVKGELQMDNSVVITHPMDYRTRVKSLKIGDWFIGIIRRRIRFIPKDIQVKWFITKHREDLRDRKPFNKFYLGGAHILCNSGLFFILQLTESKIKELGLDKNEVLKAISESKVINEVKELKALAKLLTHSDNNYLTMEEVLIMAINEIQKQESEASSLAKQKSLLYKEKLKLGCSYLRALKSCNIGEDVKVQMIGKIQHFFILDSGKLSRTFMSSLKGFQFGRQFLRKKNLRNFQENEKNDQGASDNSDFSSRKNNLIIEKLEAKLSKVYNILDGKTDLPDSLTKEELIQNLKKISNQLTSLKSIFNEASNDSNLKPSVRKKKKQNKTPVKGFIKLNSDYQLPKNVRLRTSSSDQVSCNGNISSEVDTLNLIEKESDSFSKELHKVKTQIQSNQVTSSNVRENNRLSPAISGTSKKNFKKSKNKILIIKNFKNNKTAVHKVNFYEQLNSITSMVDKEELRIAALSEASKNASLNQKIEVDDDIQIVEEIPRKKKVSTSIFEKNPT